MKPTGLSLIELLIAASITVVMLAVVVSGIKSASDSTRVIQTQQLLTEDLRTAGNLIGDELSQAQHIFGRGSKITLQTSGASYTINNFRNNTAEWIVGTDPIIAFILPPENPNPNLFEDCPTNVVHCMRFVAYYPIPRSTVVSQTVGTSNFIGDDANNSNNWTLYRYISYLSSLGHGDFSIKSSKIKVDEFAPDASEGSLLADFIDPDPNQGFRINWDASTGSKCRVSELNNLGKAVINPRAPCPASGNLESVSELVFNLRGQMSKGGNAVRVPSGEPLVFRGTPRNLSKINED